MEDLKCLVKKLEQTSNEKEQIRLLQEIGNKLLTEYVIVIPTLNVTIEPLRVEAYYYPYNDTAKFDDPCAHPSSTKVNNFGHLYFIEEKYGYPGVDLCLSLGDYYLSFLIKNSRVDGKLFKQMDLYMMVRPLMILDLLYVKSMEAMLLIHLVEKSRLQKQSLRFKIDGIKAGTQIILVLYSLRFKYVKAISNHSIHTNTLLSLDGYVGKMITKTL